MIENLYCLYKPSTKKVYATDVCFSIEEAKERLLGDKQIDTDYLILPMEITNMDFDLFFNSLDKSKGDKLSLDLIYSKLYNLKNNKETR